MEREQKKIFHDVVADALGLPKKQVINSYQNKPRPAQDFCTLRYYGYDQEVPSEIRTTAEDGVLDVISLNMLRCEVQYFAKPGGDACKQLVMMVNAFDRPTVIAELDKGGIVVVDNEPIQDISALLEHTDFETRAAVDITLRITIHSRDDVGYMENISANGSVSKT